MEEYFTFVPTMMIRPESVENPYGFKIIDLEYGSCANYGLQ
jgi:hypothetical protein